jgi:hypothetical protein
MTTTDLTGMPPARPRAYEVSRDFDYVRTLLGDDAVDDVFAGGRAVINGGGVTAPRGRLVGRVWHRAADGVWDATPETCIPWADLDWYGPFRSRAEAALFLLAMAAPKPRCCPSCTRPVVVGPLPGRELFERDGVTPHACGGR